MTVAYPPCAALVVVENPQAAEAVADRQPEQAIVYTAGMPGEGSLAQHAGRVAIASDADAGGVRIAEAIVRSLPDGGAATLLDVGASPHRVAVAWNEASQALRTRRRVVDGSAGALTRACLARGHPVERSHDAGYGRPGGSVDPRRCLSETGAGAPTASPWQATDSPSRPSHHGSHTPGLGSTKSGCDREGADVPRWAQLAGHSLWFYYHEEHQLPHVAVRGEHRATVALHDGGILAGHLPPKLHRAVRGFLSEHREEAYAAWLATQRREPPDRLS